MLVLAALVGLTMGLPLVRRLRAVCPGRHRRGLPRWPAARRRAGPGTSTPPSPTPSSPTTSAAARLGVRPGRRGGGRRDRVRAVRAAADRGWRRRVRRRPRWSAAVVNLGTYLIGLAAFALVLIGILAYRYNASAGSSASSGTWARSGRGPRTRSRRPATPSGSCPSWPGAPVARRRAGRRDPVRAQPGHRAWPPRPCCSFARGAGPRRRLLTYGSPLRRLYARFFPAYVNDAPCWRGSARCWPDPRMASSTRVSTAPLGQPLAGHRPDRRPGAVTDRTGCAAGGSAGLRHRPR